jgi:hypothetical protein
MTIAPTVPQLQQPTSPAGSAALVNSDGPADKLRTKRRRLSAGTMLLSVIVANLAMIAIIVHRSDPSSTATAHSPAQALPPPADPPGLATTLGEGKFVVGTDIAPGTYRTTGPSGHLDCYWGRLTRTSDGTGSIIANNLGPGPATVTIDNSDGAFQTRWCNTWTKVN